MADKHEMVDADFGKGPNEEIACYVHEQLTSLIEGHRDLHKNRLPKWRKAYLGRPAEESRNFPFPNAANTVVQVIGETVDTMVARVMGLVWATHPLWAFLSYVKSGSPIEMKRNEEERRTLEDFMDIVGFEPSELNLHEVEALWYTDAANLGTSFVGLNVDNQEEAVVTGYTETKDKFKGTLRSIYEGPKVCNLRHEDIVSDPARSLEASLFVAKCCHLKRFELEERGFKRHYSKKAVATLMEHPDRHQPIEQVRQENSDQGITTPPRPESTAEWDLWECYLPWWNAGRKYRLIVTYHVATRTVVRQVFNFFPNNELPIKRAKLGYRTNGLYGHGYAELLEIYQEELSTVHNQRLDNATVANIRALRVSPRARALDANCELFPAALLIGEQNEIESVQVGDVYPSTFKNEEMTLELVARRAGITPAVSGAGTGGMMRRPQQYSAQGTLAVMQENNSVVGFATSEFRHAHTQLGSSLVHMYAKFGTAGKEAMFGMDAQLLQSALDKFAQERGLHIPIRASTGSLNREIEKQTGVIVAGLLQRHYTATAQLIQAMANPMAPPDAKEYFNSVILATELLHKRIIKDFGYERPELFVPEAKGTSQPQGGGALPQGGMASGGAPPQGAGAAASGGGQGLVPQPGVGGAGGGIAPLPVR
jgi:hypothetical protein